MNQPSNSEVWAKGTIMEWRGKDVTKMTKAELIQALYEMSQLYNKNIQEHLRQLKILGATND